MQTAPAHPRPLAHVFTPSPSRFFAIAYSVRHTNTPLTLLPVKFVSMVTVF